MATDNKRLFWIVGGALAVIALIWLLVARPCGSQGASMLATQLPQYGQGFAQSSMNLGQLLGTTCEALPEAQRGQCRAQRTQMMFNGQCAELAQQDPVSGTVCYDLFRYGAYPKPLNYSVNPHPLVPSNFADQYAANEPVPWRNFKQPGAESHVVADGQWTLDLDQVDNKGFNSASEYVNAPVGQTWNERKYMPQTPTAIRSQLQEYQLVQGMPLR